MCCATDLAGSEFPNVEVMNGFDLQHARVGCRFNTVFAEWRAETSGHEAFSIRTSSSDILSLRLNI